MPPRAAKKASTTTAAKSSTRAVEREAKRALISEWIAKNDLLLHTSQTSLTISQLLQERLNHRTFTRPGSPPQAFDWSVFRTALDARDGSSPRWFIQLREEDLLLGPDGLDGVTVDCFVIAEAQEPTLAPAHYVVKAHWPYSDIEDNAPERILPLEGQTMGWYPVTKDDGSATNTFVLLRTDELPKVAGSAAAPAASFGFGAPAPTTTATTTTATAAPPSFGFGGASTASTGAISFGFGAPTPAPAAAAAPPANFGFGGAPAAPAAPTATNFGFGTTAQSGAAASCAAAEAESPALKVSRLKSSEVLFVLWSRKRLQEMLKDIKSGSRLVREGFNLGDGVTMKVVMQNDTKDQVDATARSLILNRIFAKRNPDVKSMDGWIDGCPAYDPDLHAALQEFRARHLEELADESDDFESLVAKYEAPLMAELERIVSLRQEAAQIEVDAIQSILELLREGKLAEKGQFRLLKYYAKNEVLPFRPFGKISGISEMGESVDVCIPPAHVNINPFTGKPF